MLAFSIHDGLFGAHSRAPQGCERRVPASPVASADELRVTTAALVLVDGGELHEHVARAWPCGNAQTSCFKGRIERSAIHACGAQTRNGPDAQTPRADAGWFAPYARPALESQSTTVTTF